MTPIFSTILVHNQELLYTDKVFECQYLNEHSYAIASFKHILPVQGCEFADCCLVDNMLYGIKFNKYTSKDVFLIKL